jgi:hypothetical protein
MKTLKRYAAVAILGLAAPLLMAQFGPGTGFAGSLPGGFKLDAVIAKLFGEHAAFSANLVFELQGKAEGTATIPGKVAFQEGKCRIELDLGRMKASQISPESAAQIKAMGMSELQVILRPDKKLTYLVYPGLQSYIEQPAPPSDTANAPANLKMESIELGRETVDGHPCIKNKVILTDGKSRPQEATVWNAADLKKFPLKIALSDDGSSATITLKEVQLARPNGQLFDPPSSLARYENMQSLMQEALLKRLAPGTGGARPK